MSKFNIVKDQFESRLVDGIVITQFKEKALEIVTNPAGNEDFYTILDSINDAPEIKGYVQINDGNWDSRRAVDSLVDLFVHDTDSIISGIRHVGYKHDIIAGRFKHSLGRLLLSMIQFTKPAIAGMQGEISGEYLGMTLAFDSRIATSDTTFIFDNIRTGLPPSPGISLLMPKYIGIGHTMSLIQKSAILSAKDALSLGLISDVVDTKQQLNDSCVAEIKTISQNHQHVVEYYRKHIFPPVSEVKSAFESYFDSMARSVIQLRSDEGIN